MVGAGFYVIPDFEPAGRISLGSLFPAPIARLIDISGQVAPFELFYNKNFSGRKLAWMHSFCNVEMKFNYLKKTYFVTMGTFHMGILLLFNSGDNVEKLAFSFIQKHTTLPERELVKQLQSLIDTKIISHEGEITPELNSRS
ncbi:cullin-2-like [Haliotis rubra]|uniref:cullin-2-like n=1 Tax=Haliotis rubra TaxID=36100 RepID=UPI001EE613DD|nr:cullin-2-like [Haliotis rubra]